MLTKKGTITNVPVFCPPETLRAHLFDTEKLTWLKARIDDRVYHIGMKIHQAEPETRDGKTYVFKGEVYSVDARLVRKPEWNEAIQNKNAATLVYNFGDATGRFELKPANIETR